MSIDEHDQRQESAARVADEVEAVASFGGPPGFRLKMLEMAAKMREMLARDRSKLENGLEGDR